MKSRSRLPIKLVKHYCTTVGRNANFVMGVVMDRRGLVPAADVEVLKKFGQTIQELLGKPVAETTGAGKLVELKLPAATRISNVIIMEDIAKGERIQNYTLSGQLPGGPWKELARGQSVGHKRIERSWPLR